MRADDRFNIRRFDCSEDRKRALTEAKEGVAQSEANGPFYEDMKVGDKFRHRLGRTLTDADNIWFSLLTCNTNQIHFNQDYVARNFSREPFRGRLVVNSLLVFSIVLGLSTEDTSKNGIMLGVKELNVKAPTFAGDTIYAETTIIDKRESKSHESMGIVTVETSGFNQTGQKVMEFQRTFMILKAGRQWE